MGSREAALPAIAGYDVIGLIGRGGFSAVYRAVQLSMDRPVAIKVLDAWDPDAEDERRFRVECRSVGALSWHPHIVAVFDAGVTEDNRPFMSMELLEEGSLAQSMRRTGPLRPDEVVRVGMQMCDALAAAHEAGIVHRDVKPANILIGRRGEYVLSDFGIAAFDDSSRSSTGSFSGTLAFTAPEVLLGERATVRSDVFSLGVSLHSLLLGSNSYATEGTSPGAVIQRVLNDPLPDLPAATPSWVGQVIERSCAKSPEHRFENCEELREALAAGPPTNDATAPPASSTVAQELPPVFSSEQDDHERTVARPVASSLGPSAPQPSSPPVPPPSSPPVPPPPPLSVLQPDAPSVPQQLHSAESSTPSLPDTAAAPSEPPHPEDAVDQPAGSRRRRWVVLVVLGALVVGVAAAAIWSSSSSDVSSGVAVDPSYSDLRATEVGILALGFDGSRMGYVDPSTLRIRPSAALEDVDTSEAFAPPLVAGANGSLWSLVRSGDSTSELVQIDPSTDRVIQQVPLDIASPGFLVAAAGALWTNSTRLAPSPLQIVRIDLADLTTRVVHETTPGGLATLAESNGATLWIEVVDLDQKSKLVTLDLTGPAPPSESVLTERLIGMAPAEQGVWLVEGLGDPVLRFEDPTDEQFDPVPIPMPDVVDVDGTGAAIWVLGVGDDEALVARYDLLTGDLIGESRAPDFAGSIVGLDDVTAGVYVQGSQLIEVSAE